MSKLTRLAQIGTYAKLARSPGDVVRLAALAYARGHPFDGADLPARVARRLWPRIVVSPRGFRPVRIELDPTDRGDLDSFEEIAVERVYDLSRVPFEPDLVTDCGAHIGLFSLLAANRFPAAKLVAFEPNPRNAEAIRAQIKLNPARTRLELQEAAVSTADGEARFSAHKSNAGGLRTKPGANAFSVKTIDLGGFITRAAPQRLLMKMDIEGHEERVIPAVAPLLPPDCALFFETHRGEAGFLVVAEALRNVGFQVDVHRSRGVYSDGWAVRTTKPALTELGTPR